MGDANALGFAPFGFLSTTTVIHIPSGFQSYGKTAPQVASATNIKDLSYGGARVLEVLTKGAPTGDVARFIDFILSPQVNTQICAATGFVSIYA
jgi:ABC-type phosphate transport system substrate-binding protein